MKNLSTNNEYDPDDPTWIVADSAHYTSSNHYICNRGRDLNQRDPYLRILGIGDYTKAEVIHGIESGVANYWRGARLQNAYDVPTQKYFGKFLSKYDRGESELN